MAKRRELALLAEFEKVLDSVREEIALHFATNSRQFVRSGRMAILFNGDYFILRIDPEGRLNQFYST